MTQSLSISVEMDAESFHKFAVFDLFRHKKAWQRPLLFAVILLAAAGICLSQVGKRDGAALLTVVLAVVALGLPAAWFGMFFRNLKTQIRKMGLPRSFYRLELGDTVLDVWMAGGQDKTKPSHQYPWRDLHMAYRTADAVYLYVQQNQAYLINENEDAVWAFLNDHLPADHLRDLR